MLDGSCSSLSWYAQCSELDSQNCINQECWHIPVIATCRMGRREGQAFKAIFGHKVCSRLTWDVWDSVLKTNKKPQRSDERCFVARDGQTSCVDLVLCISHFIDVSTLEILPSPTPPSVPPSLCSFLSAISPSFFPPALPFPQCLLQFQVLCLQGTYRNVIRDHLTIFEDHVKISSWAVVFCYLFGKSISGQSQNRTFTILHEPGFLPGDLLPLPDLGKAAASVLTIPPLLLFCFRAFHLNPYKTSV